MNGFDWHPQERLEATYQEAFGAVVYGVHWNGFDVEQVTTEEALEAAAVFLKTLRQKRIEGGEAL